VIAYVKMKQAQGKTTVATPAAADSTKATTTTGK
jgi:hypothetical protein